MMRVMNSPKTKFTMAMPTPEPSAQAMPISCKAYSLLDP